MFFVAYAVIIAGTGLASPHLSWGHLPVSPAVGQTLIILVDFLLLFVGFRLYIRSVRAEERRRHLTRERLMSSYRYIGVANRKLEIFADFVERISGDDDPRHIRERIGEYLAEITGPLLGSDRALLRIIDQRSGRTVTEWSHDLGGGGARLRIRNRQVSAGWQHRSADATMLVDSPAGFATAAVILTDRPSDETTRAFVKTMLRFLHLTFACTESPGPRRPAPGPAHVPATATPRSTPSEGSTGVQRAV